MFFYHFKILLVLHKLNFVSSKIEIIFQKMESGTYLDLLCMNEKL